MTVVQRISSIRSQNRDAKIDHQLALLARDIGELDADNVSLYEIKSVLLQRQEILERRVGWWIATSGGLAICLLWSLI